MRHLRVPGQWNWNLTGVPIFPTAGTIVFNGYLHGRHLPARSDGGDTLPDRLGKPEL